MNASMVSRRDPNVPIFASSLIDHIINHADIVSLRDLSLVSRDWLAPSRRRIFRDVVADQRPGKSFADFANLLDDNPQLFYWTERFWISGSVSFPLLLRVLEKLPLLRALSLRRVTFTHIPIILPPPPSYTLSRSLDNIFLSQVDVGTEGATPLEVRLYLLRLFPTVAEISTQLGPTFSENDIKSWKEQPLPAATVPKTVLRDALILSRTGFETPAVSGSVVRAVLDSFDLRTVTQLSLPVWPVDCGTHHVQILHAVRASLTHLTLDMCFFTTEDANPVTRESARLLWEDLNLASCTSLEAVRFVFYSHHDKNDSWTHVIDILTTLPPSTSLSHITLQTSFDDYTIRREDLTSSPLDLLLQDELMTYQLPLDLLQDVLMTYQELESVAFSVERWAAAQLVGVTQNGILNHLPRLRQRCSIDFYEFGTDWGMV